MVSIAGIMILGLVHYVTQRNKASVPRFHARYCAEPETEGCDRPFLYDVSDLSERATTKPLSLVADMGNG